MCDPDWDLWQSAYQYGRQAGAVLAHLYHPEPARRASAREAAVRFFTPESYALLDESTRRLEGM